MNNEKVYLEYELSSEQKRIYVLEKLNENTTIYNMPSIVQVPFEINLDYLQEILNKVIDRHESLRTSFVVNDGKIVQRVYNQVECNIKKYVLHNNQSITEIVDEFVRPFRLEKAPLLRVAFIENNDKNYLLLDMHHIISDGKSEKIFLNDFYSLVEGKSLLEMEMQYKDYVKQQNDLLLSKRINVAKQFWLENFERPLEPLQLPTDYPRPEMQQFDGSKEIFEIKGNIVSDIKNFCKTNGLMVNQFLVTSLIVALHKITGQEDIVVGTPVDSRRKAAHNQIIGLFINTLPIRAFPEKHKTFLQLSKEIARYMFLAMKYQDYTLDMLVKDVDFPKDLSRNPIFDVAFLFNSDIVLDEQSSRQYYETKSSKADFTIEITDFSDSLKFIMEYCTNLFILDTCRRFGNIFINVIKQVVQCPELKLVDISRIPEEEKIKLLHEWNDTTKKFDKNKTVNDLLDCQLNENNGVALTFGQECITYKELNSYVDKFAGFLRCNGVERESIVSVMMDPSIDMVIAILGIIKAGGAYLPIDKKTPKDRVDFILKDSNSKMLIADEQIHEKAVVFNRNNLPDISTEICNINKPNDLLYVIYTSGSTGKPKGVMVKHENVCNFVYAMKDSIHLHTHKKILLLTTICFDISVLEMIVPLTLGMEVVIASSTMQNDMRSLLNYIGDTDVDILQFTPSRFNMLTMFEGWEDALHSVKTILIGGESFPEILLKKLSNLPELEIYNMYGPTETTIWSTVSKINIDDEIITIGKPINNTQIYILNNSKECILPGEVGEIYIAGDGVTKGYINQPELTSEKFTINPYTGKIMYATGDLGKWDPNGNIICLGRKDFQVKIRGYRIETGEIEMQMQNWDEINQAVVVDFDDDTGTKYLCAYLTGTEIDSDVMRNRLRGFLPEYMIPSYFVFLKDIPLNNNGKVDRHKLPLPGKDVQSSKINNEIDNEAKNDTEIQIEEIWKKVLGLDSPIDVHMDFFDLGGNSMLAIQADVMFEQVDLPIHGHTIYKYRTIRNIAKFVIDNDDSNEIVNVKVKEREIKKITYDENTVMIEGIEPFNDMFFESCFYNSMFAIIKYYNIDISELIKHYNMDYLYQNNDDMLKITASGDWDIELKELLGDRGVFYTGTNKCDNIVYKIKTAISREKPVILWIDCYYESYRKDKYKKEHFPHTITVYGYNDDNKTFNIIEHDRADNVTYDKIEISFSEMEDCYNGFLENFYDDNYTYYEFGQDECDTFSNDIILTQNHTWNFEAVRKFHDDFKNINPEIVESEFLYNLVDGLNQIINCLRIESLKAEKTEVAQFVVDRIELWEKLRANFARSYYRNKYMDSTHNQNIKLLEDILLLEKKGETYV